MTQPPQDGFGGPRFRGRRPPPPQGLPPPQGPPPPLGPPPLQGPPPPQGPPPQGYPPPEQHLPPTRHRRRQPREKPRLKRPFGRPNPLRQPPPAPGVGYAPRPPGGRPTSKRNLAVLIAVCVLALGLVILGIYFTASGEGGGQSGANPKAVASAHVAGESQHDDPEQDGDRPKIP
ncbi:hypothetical protein [Streptomyces albidus (ex Kaewkla and Franco 2022)]|uniref:hypothetical protein n=1 Tax=Streptomyces albidus (ex Kaewkla and Franco 2022) TaxID=722709 RepID=UPI0015EF1DD8|nr:hypothetical protein [Streptomyces albidus (ex Kaewkla and Franco 2022)]